MLLPYVRQLDQSALEFLALLGGLEIREFAKLRICFKEIPPAICRLVMLSNPKNPTYEVDTEPEIELITPPFDCEFKKDSEMVFNASVVCPNELVQTTHHDLNELIPETFAVSAVSDFPNLLETVSRRYIDGSIAGVSQVNNRVFDVGLLY
jgi:hypothetical protein